MDSDNNLKCSASESDFVINHLTHNIWFIPDTDYLLLLKTRMPHSFPAYRSRPPLDPNPYQLLPLTSDFRSSWNNPLIIIFSGSWSSIENHCWFQRTFVPENSESWVSKFHLQGPTEVFPDQKALYRSSSASDLPHLLLMQGARQYHQFLIINLYCFWDSNQFRSRYSDLSDFDIPIACRLYEYRSI